MKKYFMILMLFVLGFSVSAYTVVLPPPPIISIGANASTFTQLTDAPHSYVGQDGKVVTVNESSNSLVFTSVAGTGTVTSVGTSGKYLYTSVSGPITSAGNILFNESDLNKTIDARASSGTSYNFNYPLYNTSNNVFWNGQDYYNKTDIDNLIPVQALFYFRNISSDLSGLEMVEVANTSSPLAVYGFSSVTDGQNLLNFSSDNNTGYLNLNSGHIIFHIDALQTFGNKDVKLFYEFYVRNSTGQNNLVCRTVNTNSLTSTSQHLFVECQTDFILVDSIADRFFLKIFANVSSGGSASNIQLQFDDNTATGVGLPTPRKGSATTNFNGVIDCHNVTGSNVDLCNITSSTTSGNPFDQSLNTTDTVNFNALGVGIGTSVPGYTVDVDSQGGQQGVRASSNVNQYYEGFGCYNNNNGDQASCDITVNNAQSTITASYGDIGFTSPSYDGTVSNWTSLGPNDFYIYAADNSDLKLLTTTPNHPISIFIGGITSDKKTVTFEESSTNISRLHASDIKAPHCSGFIESGNDILSNGDGSFNVSTTPVHFYETANPDEWLDHLTCIGGTFTAATQNTTYVYCDYNNGNPIFQITNDPSIIDGITKLRYARVERRTSTSLHLQEDGWNGYACAEQTRDFLGYKKIEDYFVKSGFDVLTVDTGLNPTLGGGVAFAGSHEYDVLTSSPAVDRGFLIYHNGSSSYIDRSVLGLKVNNTYYDNGTDWVLIPVNKTIMVYFERGIEDPSDHYYVYTDTQLYDNVEQALASPKFINNYFLLDHAMYQGRCPVQQGNTSISGCQVEVTGQAGGSGGTTSYNSLTDLPNLGIYALSSQLDNRTNTIYNISLADHHLSGNLTTFHDVYNLIWSAGIVSGCQIVKNPDTTINVSSCQASIRESASSSADLVTIQVPATNNLALSEGQTFVIYDYNGGTPQITTAVSIDGFNCKDKCHVATCGKYNGKVSCVDATEQNVDGNAKDRRRIYETDNLFVLSKGTAVLSYIGLNVTLTAGKWWQGLATNTNFGGKSFSAFDTSVSGQGEKNTFVYYYRNGTGGWNNISGQKILDPNKYDAGNGSLATISNNFYSKQCVYAILDDTNTSLAILYDEDSGHTTLNNANADECESILPPNIMGTGKLVGSFVVQQGSTTPSAVFVWETDTSGTGGGSSYHNSLLGKDGGDGSFYGHLGKALYDYLVANATKIDNITSSSYNVDVNLTTINSRIQFINDSEKNDNSTQNTLMGNINSRITEINATQKADNGTLTTAINLKATITELQKTNTTAYQANDTAKKANDTANSVMSLQQITNQTQKNDNATLTAAINGKVSPFTCSAGQFMNSTSTCNSILAGGSDGNVTSIEVIGTDTKTIIINRSQGGNVNASFTDLQGSGAFNNQSSNLNASRLFDVAQLNNDLILSIFNISATGTPSATTYLRGDGSWATPTASASVPGSATEVAYRNSTDGSIAGTPKVKISPEGNLVIMNSSEPATISDDGVLVWAENRGEESLLKYKGDSGYDKAVQASMAYDDIQVCTPAHSGTGTTVHTCNFGYVAGVGTVSNPAKSYVTGLKRDTMTWNVLTSAAGLDEHKGLGLHNARGNSSYSFDNGGYKLVMRYYDGQAEGSAVGCFGMVPSITAYTINSNCFYPTFSQNSIFVGFNSSNGAIIGSNMTYWISNATSIKKVMDCGSNYPFGNNSQAYTIPYETTILAKMNGGNVSIYTIRLDNASIPPCTITIGGGDKSLPVPTTPVAWRMFMGRTNVTAGTTGIVMGMNKVYLSKDD